jgi:hypothetical protein
MLYPPGGGGRRPPPGNPLGSGSAGLGRRPAAPGDEVPGGAKNLPGRRQGGPVAPAQRRYPAPEGEQPRERRGSPRRGDSHPHDHASSALAPRRRSVARRAGPSPAGSRSCRAPASCRPGAWPSPRRQLGPTRPHASLPTLARRRAPKRPTIAQASRGSRHPHGALSDRRRAAVRCIATRRPLHGFSRGSPSARPPRARTPRP